MQCPNFNFAITDDGYLKFSCDGGCTWKVIGKCREEGIPVPGKDATIEIASTETLDAGEEAKVENIGEPSSARLKFYIPRGNKGEQGVTPLIGEKGTWVIDGEDTNLQALGKNGTIVIEDSPDIGDYGVPSITTRTEDTTCYIQFHCLKGVPGTTPLITAIQDETGIITLYVDGEEIVSWGGNVVNDGTFTLQVASQPLKTFSANQANNDYLNLNVTAGLEAITSQENNLTIKLDGEYLVASKTAIITTKKATTLNQFLVCDKITSDIYSLCSSYETDIAPLEECTFAWTKDTTTVQYVGLVRVSSTDSISKIRITVKDISNPLNIVETEHLAIVIEDTWSGAQAVFTVITTLSWDIKIKLASNEYWCYLEVPATFQGSIIVNPLFANKQHSSTGSGYNVGCFYDNANTCTILPWYQPNTKTDIALFDTLKYGSYDASITYLKQPFGKYQVDIIYEKAIAVDDSISPIYMHSVLLSNLIKKVDSLINEVRR